MAELDLSQVEKVPAFCPLCDFLMVKSGDYYQCKSNDMHRIHKDKEWARVISGEKDYKWLRWRMSVRRGKMAQRDKHDKTK